MAGRLDGKIALVTGASKGIGADIARRFSAEGAVVVLGYRTDADAAEALVAEFEQAGRRAIALGADLSDPDQAQGLMDRVKASFGRLDILVNNAAFVAPGEIDDFTPAQFDRQFNLNVRAVLHLVHLALPLFAKNKARIINISSRSGLRPVGGAAVYCATKAALNAITVSLAQELGARGISVNAIAPGPTRTKAFLAQATDEDIEELIAITPFARLAEPRDIASVALFLASDDSDWITGEVLAATGGL